MIDKHSFAIGMGLLAGAFNKNLDGAVSRTYYSVLGQRLSTAEFGLAVTAVLESETFWPAPAVILGKVARLKEDTAALAFEHVNRITSEHGGFRYLPHEVYTREFDTPTRAAIAAVGGLAQIANTTEDRWPSLAKRFRTAYQDAISPPALEAADYKLIAAGERVEP